MPVAPAAGRTAAAGSVVVQLLRRRPALARAAVGALSALALSASPLAPQTATVHADVSPALSPSLAAPAPFMQSSFEQSIVDLVNQDRLANGLAPLDFDPWLLATARQRAADQLTQPTLNHYDALGQLAFVKLLTRDGVGYQLAGENLARLRGLDEGTALRAEDALMHSPTHRANILEPTFNRVAVGATMDDQGRVVLAQIFRADPPGSSAA